MTSFERALEDIQTRVCAFLPQQGPGEFNENSDCNRFAIAVAYSGGLDSSALLHLAHAYALGRQIDLFAFHIHHGISPHADQWLTHCEQQCIQLGIGFDAQRIELAHPNKQGVEQAARIGRYAALGDLCRAHRVLLLLTAHHQDDQAETLLLQLLRGSGLAGLSGMDQVNIAANLLGDASVVMGRPLLQFSRAALVDFVTQKKISHIEDESNHDPRYARNALRHQVMPVLAQSFPGFQARFARAAQHAQSAQRLLSDLAAGDLATCLEGDCLDIHALRRLSVDRIDNLLRYWFSLHAVRMPSTAWLHEVRTQLLQAKADAQLCVIHADCHIRRHRNRVFLIPKPHPSSGADGATPMMFQWRHEACLHFPTLGGTLYFDRIDSGISEAWLQSQALTIRPRQGGECVKLAPNRPSKSLKYHYQARGIPAWERQRLPIVTTQDQVLFAAGIGVDCRFPQAAMGIGLRWQLDFGVA